LRTRGLSKRWLAAVAIAAALAAPGLAGQRDLQRRNPPAAEKEAQDPDDGTVKLDAELVMLDVSVVDRANRPVFDLGKQRFQILEDGAPQSIDFFSRELAPVSLGVAIDTSGSMRSKLDGVVQAATNLVHSDKATDEAAVIQFKDQVELIEEFTSDSQDVEDALGDLIANGQTSLLDAIMLSCDYVQKEGRHRRKALVVVSDGLEKGSYYSLEQVVDHVRKLDVRLYLIGFTADLEDSAGIFKRSQKSKAEELLAKLAEETGGRAFFPKETGDLAPITDQIAQDLRTVYAIGYYPTNTKKDGTYRKVDVKMLGPDQKPDAKLAARTRAGYVADKQ
jgi:Ca-activated chloride channel family protein